LVMTTFEARLIHHPFGDDNPGKSCWIPIILLVMTINLDCHPFGARKIPPLSLHQKQPVQDLNVDSRVGIDLAFYPYYLGIHCIFICISPLHFKGQNLDPFVFNYLPPRMYDDRCHSYLLIQDN
jgi:hypothetical protein